MKLIKPLQAGDARTMLSASTANELIQKLNSLLLMKGINGVTVSVADGNVVIDGSGRIENTSSTIAGGGDSSELSFGGDWDPDEDYAVGTIVIVDEDEDIDDGTVAGQYVALTDNPHGTPKPGTPGSETNWQLSARGNWKRLKIRFPGIGTVDIDCRGTEPASGGQPQLLITSEVDQSAVYLRLADLGGQQARFLPTTMCVGGVSKTSYVLRTPEI